MKLPPIVGLLLNYRDAERSIACIKSLLDEGLTQVLVWDNSADGGVSARDIENFFVGDTRVQVFVSSRNLGFATGVNAGLKLCAAQKSTVWALLINNDARLLPGAVEKLARSLQNNPDAKLAFPTINHAGQALGPAYCQYWTGMLFWSPRAGCFPYASGCCLLIALERVAVPLFDEDFFMYGEDCELGWRLRASPESLLHVPDVLVDHDGSASSGLGSEFYEERMVASHLILVRKLAGVNPIMRLLLYSTRSIMLLARAFVRSLRYRSLVPLRALQKGAAIAFISDPLRQHD